MPKPKQGETEKEFLKRCIPDLKDEGYTDNKQRIAICYSKYRREGTEEKSSNPKKKLTKSQKTGLYYALCH